MSSVLAGTIRCRNCSPIASARHSQRYPTITQFTAAQCKSMLLLSKRMDKVDGLFEGIAREVHSARYAGSADYSDKLRCSVVEGDSPKMLR
jgi:hypothetical protein